MLKTSKALLDATFVKPWNDLSAHRRAAEVLHRQSGAGIDALRQDANDAVAQSDVGCFYCFYKGDWDRGLPHLKRGAISTWRRLADQELKGPIAADDQLWMAAGWWEAASSAKSFASQQIKLHAARWYQRAFPKMPAGDTRDAVEAKLCEMRLDANSEAVAKGVRWLIERQLDDGSWTFKSEPDAGNFNNQLAATAMALRVLLEADLGDGKNQAAIRNGLEYVRSAARMEIIAAPLNRKAICTCRRWPRSHCAKATTIPRTAS